MNVSWSWKSHIHMPVTILLGHIKVPNTQSAIEPQNVEDRKRFADQLHKCFVFQLRKGRSRLV